MAQQPALHHDSSSSVASDSSGASDLNFECFTGAQTLAQFIQAIEGATGSQVLSVSSNSLNYLLCMFPEKKSFIFAFSYGLNSQNISAN